jgi:predicted  nucleic acid-binding Zn-ribbon protein
MNAAIQTLLKLQALEFAEQTSRQDEKQIADYRQEIPAPVLAHYDRLRIRGKKGVAVVRNQTCGGCHMKQPLGTITALMRGEDVQLCDTCGRYLYLPDEAERAFVENMAAIEPAPPAPKTARKPRAKRKPEPAAA